MAALTPIVPSNTGTLSAGAAVAASDTIAADLLGSKGALLEILNAGGSTDNITITDFGTTAAGNALTGNTVAGSVATATNRVFTIRPTNVNPATNVVTITHSFTTSVTYKLYTLSAV